MRSILSATTMVLLATVLSTHLVSAAPLVDPQADSKSLSNHAAQVRDTYLGSRASQFIDNPTLRALGLAKDPGGSVNPDTQSSSTENPYDSDYAHDSMKRASDDQTAGGNAYTGNSGNVSSGDIDNVAGPDSTITNTSGNNVGAAGETVTGDARGGEGKGRGPGGNAYTGSSGNANGGTIHNDAGVVQNMASANNAGEGGVSESGVATGGGN